MDPSSRCLQSHCGVIFLAKSKCRSKDEVHDVSISLEYEIPGPLTPLFFLVREVHIFLDHWCLMAGYFVVESTFSDQGFRL